MAVQITCRRNAASAPCVLRQAQDEEITVLHWQKCRTNTRCRDAQGKALTRRAARGEVAAGDALAIMLERPAHRGESELVPRDLVPGEELDLEALGAGGEFRRA